MHVFINESSLHGQYHSVAEFEDALKKFVSLLESIKCYKRDLTLRSETLFLMSGTSSIKLANLVKTHADLAVRLRTALQETNVKSWYPSQVHDANSKYLFNKVDYCGCSIAEFAEIKIQNGNVTGFLINFIGSIFSSSTTIQIDKNGLITTTLDCIFDDSSINSWLVANGLLSPVKNYVGNSNLAPDDNQTVLCDQALFALTNYPKNKGRKVYRRIGTNQLWVVDGTLKHATDKAHIEVFDENTQKHLGTSLIAEVRLDTAFKKRGRKIYLG